MGLFGVKKVEATDNMKAEIKRLGEEIDRLQTAISDKTEELGLSDEIIALKKKIVELEIVADKKTEDFDRRERELEHMIGLERNRQEVEITQATREAELKVRESNLSTSTDQIQEQLKFFKDQLTEQVNYLKGDIVKALLDRLPTVTVDRYIGDRPVEKEKVS